MGRFDPTVSVDVPGLEHSVADLSWGVLRGALGPSDGSAGASSNVPSALAVLRHAQIYLQFPEEIDEAFCVLEQHVIRHGVLYPVALTVVPFLFDIIRRGTPVAERMTDLIAEYASAAHTLEEPQHRRRLQEMMEDNAVAIMSWLGIHDRAAVALALYVPGLRDDLFATIRHMPKLAPEVLLALIELDDAPAHALALALDMLDDELASDTARMCAAAFVARFGQRTPELMTRVDAALPPSAPAALRTFVGKLWAPTIEFPVVAPKLYDAEVVFAGANLVLVRAGNRSVTLPWRDSHVGRGDVIKVGITAHGQPKLVVLTEPDGRVRVIDF